MKITITVEADSIEGAVSKLRGQIGQYEAMAQSVERRKEALGDPAMRDLPDEPPEGMPSVEDVRIAMREVLTRKGPAGNTALLSKFGASNASDVPANKRAGFLAAAKELLS